MSTHPDFPPLVVRTRNGVFQDRVEDGMLRLYDLTALQTGTLYRLLENHDFDLSGYIDQFIHFDRYGAFSNQPFPDPASESVMMLPNDHALHAALKARQSDLYTERAPVLYREMPTLDPAIAIALSDYPTSRRYVARYEQDHTFYIPFDEQDIDDVLIETSPETIYQVIARRDRLYPAVLSETHLTPHRVLNQDIVLTELTPHELSRENHSGATNYQNKALAVMRLTKWLHRHDDVAYLISIGGYHHAAPDTSTLRLFLTFVEQLTRQPRQDWRRDVRVRRVTLDTETRPTVLALVYDDFRLDDYDDETLRPV